MVIPDGQIRISATLQEFCRKLYDGTGVSIHNRFLNNLFQTDLYTSNVLVSLLFHEDHLELFTSSHTSLNGCRIEYADPNMLPDFVATLNKCMPSEFRVSEDGFKDAWRTVE